MTTTRDPREIVAAAIDAHAPWGLNAAGQFICDCDEAMTTGDLDADVTAHQLHRAAAVLAALESAGWSLLPPGGQSHTERGYWNPDTREVQSWWSYADGGYKVPDRTRAVTVWPDGRQHYGPWQPTDTPEADHG